MLNLDARYAFVENLKKRGLLDREIENTKRETAFEMLKDGLSLDKIAHYVKMPTEWVQNLKDSQTTQST